MRVWLATIFCIVFAVYGTLNPVAHTMAHADVGEAASATEAYQHTHDHHDHSFDAFDDGDERPSKPDASDGHGAELHFSALHLSANSDECPLPRPLTRLTLTDIHPPSPLLAPDPDPDRI